MPTLWNLDHQPVVLNWQEPAIMPGESHEFTDEEVAAGLTGLWGEQDPRAGLAAEKTFKRRRDAAVSEPSPGDDTTTEPAESGDTKE